MADEAASSMGYARKSFASFWNCEPTHYYHEPSIFALESGQMEKL
jgi:hypothetical protein